MAKATPSQLRKAVSEIPEKMPIETLVMEMSQGADVDAHALASLAQITRLAAFATEARRTLEGIEGVMRYHPEAAKTMRETVPAWSYWSMMDDEVAPVLTHIADSMDELAAAIQKRAVDRGARFRR